MDVVDLVLEHCSAHDHLVIAAVQATEADGVRLHADRESFDAPHRCADGGEDGPRPGHATEDRAYQPAEPACDIEVEDVSELVHDDQVDPVARVLQLERVDRRLHEDYDAV